jgi:hypothetical protein
MSYLFKELQYGPSWKIIKDGLPRRSAGEAFARDWLQGHGLELICLEVDTENDAIDIMAAKHGILYQYAIEQG